MKYITLLLFLLYTVIPAFAYSPRNTNLPLFPSTDTNLSSTPIVPFMDSQERRDYEAWRRYQKFHREDNLWLDTSPFTTYEEWRDYRQWRRSRSFWSLFEFADVPAININSNHMKIQLPWQPLHNPYYWEINVSWLVSKGSVYDAGGYLLTKYMDGWKGSILYNVTESVSIGMEISELKADSLRGAESLSYIKRETIMAIIKNRMPVGPFYLIGGIGKGEYKSKFRLSEQKLDGSSWTGFIGAGLDLRIYKEWHITIEGRRIWDKDTWHNFVMQGPKWRDELSCGVSFRFGQKKQQPFNLEPPVNQQKSS